MRGQRKNPRKAVQPFENKKRKIDIFKNYEANGVEKIQRKLEIFSTLISKKSNQKIHLAPRGSLMICNSAAQLFKTGIQITVAEIAAHRSYAIFHFAYLFLLLFL